MLLSPLQKLSTGGGSGLFEAMCGTMGREKGQESLPCPLSPKLPDYKPTWSRRQERGLC